MFHIFFIICLVRIGGRITRRLSSLTRQAEYGRLASALIAGGYGGAWYTHGGEAWEFSETGVWARKPLLDLPVPDGEIRFLDGFDLITIDDIGWFFDGANWQTAGPFPGGPIASQPKSWRG